MSSTNYNGLKATNDDVFVAVDNIRSVLSAAFLKKIAKLERKAKAAVKANNKARWSDVGFLGFDEGKLDKPIGERPQFFTLYEIVDQASSAKDFTASDFAIGYTVYVMKNGLDEEPLILVFSEIRDYYVRALRKAGAVVDYSYWDTEGKPNNVTASEWARRAEAWEPVFASTISEKGVTFRHPDKIETLTSMHTKKSGK